MVANSARWEWSDESVESHGNPWDPNDDIAPGYALPIDALDGCFYDHDKCYARARNPRTRQQCTKQYDQDVSACDLKLALCAAHLSETGMSENEARYREMTIDTFTLKSTFDLLGLWGDK
jgi:hypothetical protein